MGSWGTGLYSGDFAMDLRSAVAAVARLPFEGDRLLELLCRTEASAASNPDDSDHTTFWLVVADQFARRGIECREARDKALAIIVADADLAVHARLGMTPPDLDRRRRMLKHVEARITAPPQAGGARPVLKKPQALVMEVGDVFAYPTCGGRCRNAYTASTDRDRQGPAGTPWKSDGWAALVIVDRGRAFDFLSWYWPLTIAAAMDHKPTFEELLGDVLWRLASPGTCSTVHFKRLELQKIATVALDRAKVQHAFRDMKPAVFAAVHDISICNGVDVGPYVPVALMPRPGTPIDRSRGRPYPTILGIGSLLAR